MKNVRFRNDVLPLKDALYRLALRITLNHEEAEDIVQDTLIKVWDKRESWNEIESMEAFSITICRNLALDRIKKHDNLNDSLEEKQAESPDNSSTPFEDTLLQDRLELVRNHEKQRCCMQLRDFEGKPYKEIAKILGISEEQVKVNIFRARQTVKERFQKFDNYGL